MWRLLFKLSSPFLKRGRLFPLCWRQPTPAPRGEKTSEFDPKTAASPDVEFIAGILAIAIARGCQRRLLVWALLGVSPAMRARS